MQPSGECLLWKGAVQSTGYGLTWYEGKLHLVHRLIYSLCFDDPGEMTVHHTCHERTCVNPDHLVLMTRSDHGKLDSPVVTHCKHGHEYTDDNTYWSKGQRWCRTCKLASVRRRRQS